VDHEFAPGLRAKCWGYNGRVHGPTIEAVEGDRVRVYVTNRLPAPTSVHWHSILLPSGMDGVGGLHQKAIQPGETFKYEFTLKQLAVLHYPTDRIRVLNIRKRALIEHDEIGELARFERANVPLQANPFGAKHRGRAQSFVWSQTA